MTKNAPSNERGKQPGNTPSTLVPEKCTPTPAPAYDDISNPPPDNEDLYDTHGDDEGFMSDVRGPEHRRLPHRGPPRPHDEHHDHHHHHHRHDGMPPPPPPPGPPPYPGMGFGMPPHPPHMRMGACPMFNMMGFGDPRMGMGMGMGGFGRMHGHGRGRGGPRGGGGRGGRGGFGAHHHHGHGGPHADADAHARAAHAHADAHARAANAHARAHAHRGGWRGGRHRAWRGMPWMWAAAPWMGGESPWSAWAGAARDAAGGANNDNANNENGDANMTDNREGFEEDEDDIIDFIPAMDTFDSAEQYTLMFELPGAKRSDIAVTWDEASRSLRVSGVVYRPGDEAFLQTLAADERAVGVFERVARLDGPVKAAEIVARMEDGVLRVDVPKDEEGSEKAEARTVEVL